MAKDTNFLFHLQEKTKKMQKKMLLFTKKPQIDCFRTQKERHSHPLNHREAVCCIKTSSCGTIERMKRIFVRFPQEMRGRKRKKKRGDRVAAPLYYVNFSV
jgi:hypothetical protein